MEWSGECIGGILFAISPIVHPVGEDVAVISSAAWVPAHLLQWVLLLLLQIGLVGLYSRQIENMGWMGLVGFLLAFIGTAFGAGVQYLVASIWPSVAAEAPSLIDLRPIAMVPLFVLGLGLGYILFGAAIMRARVLPRWSGLLLILGIVTFVIGVASGETHLLSNLASHTINIIGGIVFGITWVWVGSILLSEKR